MTKHLKNFSSLDVIKKHDIVKQYIAHYSDVNILFLYSTRIYASLINLSNTQGRMY